VTQVFQGVARPAEKAGGPSQVSANRVFFIDIMQGTIPSAGLLELAQKLNPSWVSPVPKKFRVVMMVYSDLAHDARVAKEASTLAEAGHEVHVVSLGSERGSELKVVQDPRNFLRHEIPRPANKGGPVRRRLRALWRSYRMVQIAEQLKGEVYHVHDANLLMQGWWVARVSKAKLVYDAHEISTHREGYRFLSGFVYWIEKCLAPKAFRMITTTQARADHFQQTYSLANPVVVLQNRPEFVDVKNFQGQKTIHARLNLNAEAKVVLYQGGLQPGRGLENFVRLATRFPGVHFVLIGSGRLESDLKSLVGDLGLTGQVHFISQVPLSELAPLTASADVGMQILQNTCLNHYTTDSNKLFEYALAGVPVVASDFPEIRKVVQAHQIGVLVSPDIFESIVAGLKMLLDDAQFWQACRENALRAGRELSWESQRGKLLREVYDLLPSEIRA